MECKDACHTLKAIRLIDLIETSWNVKKITCQLNLEELESDLIETSWNVKANRIRHGNTGRRDLIETSWNVKTDSAEFDRRQDD